MHLGSASKRSIFKLTNCWDCHDERAAQRTRVPVAAAVGFEFAVAALAVAVVLPACSGVNTRLGDLTRPVVEEHIAVALFDAAEQHCLVVLWDS
jgi:hypothetical protein